MKIAMKRARFRFYAELNDFLPPSRRGVEFPHHFQGGPSVKDAIESLGVPHTEIDLVLANGESVDFSWILREGARVSVYPVFESFDITPLARVRPAPLREIRFILDVHLGRLARYLRMLGFDARWRNDERDEDIARIASAEHRIVLTRDAGLLKRRIVTHGYRVRDGDPRRQLAEVLHRFDLFRSIVPFRRCLCCNDVLAAVQKEDVADELPAGVRERHDDFRRCPACRRLYWAGTHHRRMHRLISELLAQRAASSPAIAALQPPVRQGGRHVAKTQAVLSKAQLETLRKKLQDERRRILSVLKEPLSSPATAEARELEETAQRATERDRELAIQEPERALLADIDRALGKMDAGTYGVSERTGDPIPYERLDAVPWARYGADE